VSTVQFCPSAPFLSHNLHAVSSRFGIIGSASFLLTSGSEATFRPSAIAVIWVDTSLVQLRWSLSTSQAYPNCRSQFAVANSTNNPDQKRLNAPLISTKWGTRCNIVHSRIRTTYILEWRAVTCPCSASIFVFLSENHCLRVYK
jgi:hypothetical protein